jgi:hypothetical protein
MRSVESEQPVRGTQPEITISILRERGDLPAQISVVDLPCSMTELIQIPAGVKGECGRA